MKEEIFKLLDTLVEMSMPKNKDTSGQIDLINKKLYDLKTKLFFDKNNEELRQEITKLNQERLSLLIEPISLANEAKRLIENNDINDAISKVIELVDVLNTYPYLKENNKTLEEELAKLKNNNDDELTKYKKIIIDCLNKTTDIGENIDSLLENGEDNELLRIKDVIEKDVNDVLDIKLSEIESKIDENSREYKIKLIEKRLEIGKSPNEIYEEIDLLLGSMDFDTESNEWIKVISIKGINDSSSLSFNDLLKYVED